VRNPGYCSAVTAKRRKSGAEFRAGGGVALFFYFYFLFFIFYFSYKKKTGKKWSENKMKIK